MWMVYVGVYVVIQGSVRLNCGSLERVARGRAHVLWWQDVRYGSNGALWRHFNDFIVRIPTSGGHEQVPRSAFSQSVSQSVLHGEGSPLRKCNDPFRAGGSRACKDNQ